ncbi:hypothetical protein GA0070215_1532 [Micromonospora marina]|uniref:Uncharacterized protein n=2 Tax=Micromonospora marina TaxID=307120 RepID=A0A1C5AN68_9ACTN|nr:hypothetical protein GA0070215_1532 [Micromonospora marina]
MDAVEQVLERLRHRWPAQLTIAGAVAWALVVITLLTLNFLASGNFVWLLSAFGISPLLLLGTVAVWGVDQVPWPVWPIGVTPLVLAAGLTPSSPSGSLLVSTATAVIAFVYAQLFLLTVQSVDVLRARRLGLVDPVPPTDVHADRWHRVLDLLRLPPETSGVLPNARRRRRFLQVKVLISVLVLYSTFNPTTPLYDESGDAIYPQPVLFGELFHILVFPLVIGAIARSARVAWGAVLVLPTLFGLGLWLVDPGQRLWALLETGWIVLVAIWFWTRAATADYWGREPVEQPSGCDPYFEIRDGKVYRGKGHPDGPRYRSYHESRDS